MLFQKKIIVGIENLCSRLPEPPAKICKEEVEKMLPIAISFITSAIVSSRVPSMGYCKGLNNVGVFVTEKVTNNVLPPCPLQKPSDICKVIGLCSSCDKQVKVLQYLAKEAFQLASENVSSAQSRRPQNIILSAFWAHLIPLSASVNQAQNMPSCPFCILLVKTLEDFLPKDRSEVRVTLSNTCTDCLTSLTIIF